MRSRSCAIALSLSALVLNCSPAEAQLRFRVSGSAQQFIAGNYGNTDVGRSIDVAIMGGKGEGTRAGLAIVYGEYPLTGEDEIVADLGLDAIIDIPISHGVYMDLRAGGGVNGWDVPGLRIAILGARAGGALGYRLPFGGAALDLAVTGSYFHGIQGYTTSEDGSGGVMDSIDITGSRMGARIGITFNPGGSE